MTQKFKSEEPSLRLKLVLYTCRNERLCNYCTVPTHGPDWLHYILPKHLCGTHMLYASFLLFSHAMRESFLKQNKEIDIKGNIPGTAAQKVHPCLCPFGNLLGGSTDFCACDHEKMLVWNSCRDGGIHDPPFDADWCFLMRHRCMWLQAPIWALRRKTVTIPPLQG